MHLYFIDTLGYQRTSTVAATNMNIGITTEIDTAMYRIIVDI